MIPRNHFYIDIPYFLYLEHIKIRGRKLKLFESIELDQIRRGVLQDTGANA